METRVEYKYFLPKDVLTHIFSFLDRRTLVFSCRPVCRFWKEAVECSAVWKTQISRETKPQSSEVENILPTAHLHYPWYMCYVLCKNIFCKNLIPDCVGEENLSYWRDVLRRANGLIRFAPLVTNRLSYGVLPPDLDEDVCTCLLTSFGNCGFNQSIDLYTCGFTRKIFEYRPPIHFSEWFAVAHSLAGMCYIEVTLCDSEWRSDDENGLFRYTRQLMSREWHKVSHTFTNYRPDVRYIMLNHGVDTYMTCDCGRCREMENYGTPAAKIVGSKLLVCLPDLSESSDSE